MRYKKRRYWKYTLFEREIYDTGIKPISPVSLECLTITATGLLIIDKGYTWDGPSGPTIDTKSFMRGSLVHDALYQLIREGHICRDQRKKADQILYDICIEDGMFKWRARWVYRGVRAGGKAATDYDVLTAP